MRLQCRLKKSADENINVEKVVEDGAAKIITKAVEGAHQSDCMIMEARNEMFSDLLQLQRYAKILEDIKNRSNFNDDVIISDDEAVEQLLDEDADNDFEIEQFLQLTVPEGAKMQ
ncbi:hypothetical protein AVEN_17913-1 [Araneus ventricosus]|uniref:Uncharacterized protein n=1 Tax=Araneus ventricosus TaxID=182803 RepID=A0A4Y2FZI5_ARAVE|nr:hypothetical protein AVEN_17913-1 [Araneus ventricosus]